MDTSYTTSLKPLWKGVLYSSALMLAIVSLDIVMGVFFQVNYIIGDIKEGGAYWPAIFFLFTFILSVISIFYTYKYEVEINENGLVKKGLFNTFSFSYDDIEEVFVDIAIVSFKSGRKAISLGNLYTDYEEPVQYISNKLKERTDLRFKGNEKRIEKYFPWRTD